MDTRNQAEEQIDVLDFPMSKYKCDFEGCGKIFSNKGNMKAHTYLHTPLKNHKCIFPGCNKSYLNQCRLKVHFRTHVN
jgi:uncharacterized Zn-finger protein